MISTYGFSREAETHEIDIDVQKAEFWKEGYMKGLRAGHKESGDLLVKCWLALKNNDLHHNLCIDIGKVLKFHED